MELGRRLRTNAQVTSAVPRSANYGCGNAVHRADVDNHVLSICSDPTLPRFGTDLIARVRRVYSVSHSLLTIHHRSPSFNKWK